MGVINCAIFGMWSDDFVYTNRDVLSTDVIKAVATVNNFVSHKSTNRMDRFMNWPSMAYPL